MRAEDVVRKSRKCSPSREIQKARDSGAAQTRDLIAKSAGPLPRARARARARFYVDYFASYNPDDRAIRVFFITTIVA